MIIITTTIFVQGAQSDIQWLSGPMKLVLTKGYGVRATTIGRSTLLLQRCALRKFHVRVTVGQNTRDQITSNRRSKRAWSKCVLCIPHILSGRSSESLPHTCDACVIRGLGLTWRSELRAPLAASSKRRLNRIRIVQTGLYWITLQNKLNCVTLQSKNILC